MQIILSLRVFYVQKDIYFRNMLIKVLRVGKTRERGRKKWGRKREIWNNLDEGKNETCG